MGMAQGVLHIEQAAFIQLLGYSLQSSQRYHRPASHSTRPTRQRARSPACVAKHALRRGPCGLVVVWGTTSIGVAIAPMPLRSGCNRAASHRLLSAADLDLSIETEDEIRFMRRRQDASSDSNPRRGTHRSRRADDQPSARNAPAGCHERARKAPQVTFDREIASYNAALYGMAR